MFAPPIERRWQTRSVLASSVTIRRSELLERIGPGEFFPPACPARAVRGHQCRVADFKGTAASTSSHYSRNMGGDYYLITMAMETSRNDVFGFDEQDYGRAESAWCDLNQGWAVRTFCIRMAMVSRRPPRPRRVLHGLQWLEKSRRREVSVSRMVLSPGLQPSRRDLDGMARLDVVAVAAFADWNNSNETLLR